MVVSKITQRIEAVIVTYNPDLKALNDELVALNPQVDRLIVVDNCSANVQDLRQFLEPYGADLESLPANTGIAHAQNVGIALAKQHGAEYVLLMDQDSVPDAEMVAKLKQVMDGLTQQGQNVAAVGPRYTDSRYDEMPCFNRVRGIRMKRVGCNVPASVIEADYLIASGSLISVSVLDYLGKMAEELFIDYIDVEWGLRARASGYKSYGVCTAQLEHSLGENPVRFLGRYISVHNPIRNYYFVRNALLVYRQPYVRWNWMIADLENVVKLLLKACIVGPDRWLRFKYMLLGGWHGLLNRSGPIPDCWLTRQ